MRFVKVFLLLALFGFCVLAISGAFGTLHKKAPIFAFGGIDEGAAAIAELQDAIRVIRSDLPGDDPAVAKAFEDSKRIMSKIEPAARAVRIGEYVTYLVFVFLTTLLYLRFSRPPRSA
ncbi:hypothetical protein [Aquipseudomonas alcaligenes]|uniref:hypothetical protein n=1 Tax=Aquipseudomonas alcaligenes TaxID=43263 RepID=UPI00077FE97F|nr:hypothetical protein [Pseudomonas alcaligenes]AMR67255.1 hypothetical protein A0T30_13060 [Pseudomonas alcaligenes]